MLPQFIKPIQSIIQPNTPPDAAPGKLEPVNLDAVTPQERQTSIRNAFRFAWRGYSTFAWGHDELKPESGRFNDRWGGLGITLVDNLDTLALMGLEEELGKAREFVNDLSYDVDRDFSFFETTIRHLGGLLGAHALTQDPLFLTRARDLADRLLKSFDWGDNRDHPIPRSIVNLHTGAARNWDWNSRNSILSEIGSCQLEFSYLSRMTGDATYENIARVVLEHLNHLGTPVKGLYPIVIDPTNEHSLSHGKLTFGGMADSFYEYLLKWWQMRGRKDPWLLVMYRRAIGSLEEKLLHRVQTPEGKNLVFVGELSNGHPSMSMEHLTCFVSGLLALGSVQVPGWAPGEREALEASGPDGREHVEARQWLLDARQRHLGLAKEIGESCVELYRGSKTGLAPEKISWSQDRWSKYILRPETVESLFVLWRVTHDEVYREWGWEIFKAIETQCKTDAGYSGLSDVNTAGSLDDGMESFFLAETLKYLYLLFSDDSTLPLDSWVFTTEAHPLPVAAALQSNEQQKQAVAAGGAPPPPPPPAPPKN